MQIYVRQTNNNKSIIIKNTHRYTFKLKKYHTSLDEVLKLLSKSVNQHKSRRRKKNDLSIQKARVWPGQVPILREPLGHQGAIVVYRIGRRAAVSPLHHVRRHCVCWLRRRQERARRGGAPSVRARPVAAAAPLLGVARALWRVVLVVRVEPRELLHPDAEALLGLPLHDGEARHGFLQHAADVVPVPRAHSGPLGVAAEGSFKDIEARKTTQ